MLAVHHIYSCMKFSAKNGFERLKWVVVVVITYVRHTFYLQCKRFGRFPLKAPLNNQIVNHPS